jgi:hypothetical protein
MEQNSNTVVEGAGGPHLLRVRPSMHNRVRMRSDSAWPLRLASSSEQNRVGLALHLGRNVPLSAGRSHDAVIRVYDDAGNVIETHEHKGDFKEW